MSFFEARRGESEGERIARIEARNLAHLVQMGMFKDTAPTPGEERQSDGTGKNAAGFRRKIEAADIEAPNASGETIGKAAYKKFKKSYKQWLDGKSPATTLSIDYSDSSVPRATAEQAIGRALVRRSNSKYPATQYRDIYATGRTASGSLTTSHFDTKKIKQIAPGLKVEVGNPPRSAKPASPAAKQVAKPPPVSRPPVASTGSAGDPAKMQVARPPTAVVKPVAAPPKPPPKQVPPPIQGRPPGAPPPPKPHGSR